MASKRDPKDLETRIRFADLWVQWRRGLAGWKGEPPETLDLDFVDRISPEAEAALPADLRAALRAIRRFREEMRAEKAEAKEGGGA